MTLSTFLQTASSVWLWWLPALLAGAVISTLVCQRRIRRSESAALHWKNAYDRQEYQLEQQQRHHEQRLADMQTARQELSDRFQALSKQALSDNNQQFLTLAQQLIQTAQTQASGELEKRQQAITQTLKPVQEALGKLEAQTQQLAVRQNGAYHQLQEQIRGLVLLQGTVQQETGRLVEAIRKPTVRGRWGEMTLRRVLESAGMMANCDFTEQTNTETSDGRLRPDVVVKLPEGRHLVIDAKTPFDAYLDALHADTGDQHRIAMQHHARQVRQHIKTLGSKRYWEALPDTPEFVVLFIPGESAFSAALEADPELLEHGWQQRVVLATPTSLVATMMAVAYSWKQEAMTSSARQTVDLGKELYARLRTFTSHLQDVGKGLQRAVGSYNQSVASLESRVMPQARRFEDLGISSSDKSLPDINQIDTLPRSVTPDRDAA